MKHVLLAVSGMTPQTITETLYGISRQSPERFPTHIEIITTAEGRRRLKDNLLVDDSPLQRMLKDYNLPPVSFTCEDIKVPSGDDGEPLEDVRTEREQEIITDYITRHVRNLTADRDATVHASLAGGRKTMGFALGYAMSLFGRPNDVLSHVLVSPPYESVPDFYYPTPVSVLRADRDKQAQHDLSKATVTLANIPLVLMREEMPTALIKDDALNYTQTVERINLANQLTEETATIHLDFTHMSVICDGITVPLKADCFAFYSWIAQDTKTFQEDGIGAPDAEMSISELDDRARQFIRSALHPNTHISDTVSLEEIFDRAGDAVLNMVEKEQYQLARRGEKENRNPRNGWLLQMNEQTNYLIAAVNDRDREKLLKNHKNLWVRLLKETNQSLTDILGARLANYYKITTINSSSPGNPKDKTNQKNRIRHDYKGLKIKSANIQILDIGE